ncbi:MAG TPA: protein kinase [Gemmatimonadales bacterium]|nr:protein kinase [Gemmatimonadales bacterium]
MAELSERLRAALGDAYRIERELGGAGMSRVFLAEEVRLGRRVVIKVLPPELAAGVSAERFEREIRFAARLQHPHIVPLLTAGSQGDLLYYVMPHIAGESLRARLARERTLPVGDTVRILAQVCDALAYAHKQGIVHRDVKPDNVLLADWHALVTDFGVAKAVAESTGTAQLTSFGLALGTPAYMAPEQAAGDPAVDHRADLYAVGAMGYEMLAGRPLFSGLSPQALLAAQVTAAPELVTKHRADVPPSLAALITRCLAKDPAQRPQSAGELQSELEGMTTPTATDAAAHTGALGRPRHPVQVGLLFGLAGIGVLALDRLFVRLLGLPDWVFGAGVGLVAVGLPVATWTGVLERRRARAAGSGSASASGAGASVGPTPTGVERWFTWRRAGWSGASAAALLVLTTALYMGMRLLGIGPVGTLVAHGVLAHRDALVLADFANRTPDSTLGRSVAEAFRVDLGQSKVVRLLDAATAAAALARMGRAPGGALDVATARELAAREGAKAVVSGTIDPVGRGFLLSAALVAASDGAELVAVRETAKDDGALIDAVDRLSKRLRERIGESLRAIRESDPLERVTTASLPALVKYSEGVKASDDGAEDRAIELLEQAIALDSGFAMAYRKLTVALGNSGASYARIANAGLKAFQHRDRLPPFERDLTEARYYSVIDYDTAKAAAAYRGALDLDPTNQVALNNLAIIENQERHYAAADSLLGRALATPHPLATLYMNAAVAEVGLGRFDRAAETLRRFAAQYPTHPLVPFVQLLFATSHGAYDSAAVYLRAAAISSTPLDLSVDHQLSYSRATFADLRGQLATSDREWRRFMELSDARHLPGSYVTGAIALAFDELYFRTRPAVARSLVQGALTHHPLAAMAPEDRPYAFLAWFYAQAGLPDRARELMAEYERVVPEGERRGDALRQAAFGAIAFATGRIPEAIRRYRESHDERGCAGCALYEMGQAYERAGQPDSARAAYEHAVSTPGLYRLFELSKTLAATYRRLGELYEERGDRARASEYYGLFVDLWKDADPELQPLVRDARARLARLAAEPHS